LPKENINTKWSKSITNEDLWNTSKQISKVEQIRRSNCRRIGSALKTPQEATEDCSGLVSPRQ
jgi:hypothetical protein